jgi:hypothetical protein
MINVEKFRPVLIAAEKGDAESIALVTLVLKPLLTDSIEEIEQKIRYYIRINYFASLKYKDSFAHTEIDKTFAEQIYSFLHTGQPRWKQILIIGYRESAKTSRVKMNQSYMNLYLKDIIDYINIVSSDGANSSQFTMDMFNAFSFSKIAKYYPDTISDDFKRGKKESQTMSKFTTTTGVTYSASSALKTKRGSVQQNIGEDGEIVTKRPKQAIFDDIENETTVRSYPVTQQIRSVMNATIDGLDQTTGFWILLGNYLSLRGNVNYLLTKYRDVSTAKIIMIPIYDGTGVITWPAKYCATDLEKQQLFEKDGTVKVSIESIKRDSDNFETEYLNNPKRSRVYFDDNVLQHINTENLVSELSRDKFAGCSEPEGFKDGQGLLLIEQPDATSVYEMSVDAAGGNGGDQSAFTIYKVTGMKYKEVGNFRCNTMKPEIFASFSVNYARLYNNARIVPERNYPGNEYIAFVRAIYTNVYYEDKEKDIVGIQTNLKTKPEMFLKFKKYLLDDILEIQSEALYRQIMEYPASDIETIIQDDSGGHFDLLMSAVIGIYKVQSILTLNEDDDEVDLEANRVADSLFMDSISVR